MYLDEGCYTDMVTPRTKDGEIDYRGLSKKNSSRLLAKTSAAVKRSFF